MFINHEDEEIRIYDFHTKEELDVEDKGKLIFSLMKQLILLPNVNKSKVARYRDLKSYTLLLNGYLLDGSFKDKNKEYPSICTEFMNLGTYNGEPLESIRLRYNVQTIYNQYKDKLGKEVISMKVVDSSVKERVIRYFEMINTATILREYLKDKEIFCEIVVYGNIFKKEREFIIRPAVKNRWQ